MNHNHNCSCDHANVKFCKTCQVVHCLDCNQEWTKRTWSWGYPITYSSGYLTTTPQYTAVGTTKQQEPVTTTLTSTCGHKA